ncbi:MAG: hypothetical protein IKP49_12485, partial [Treponema sp.]|nr:hypothetical protein [Treponema sp.]
LGDLFKKSAKAPADAGANYNSTKFSISSFKGVSGDAVKASSSSSDSSIPVVAIVIIVVGACIILKKNKKE